MSAPRRERNAKLAALLWSLMVAVLLTMPTNELPSTSSDWLDKPVHALLFGVHCLLLLRLCGGRPSAANITTAAIASALYAAALEALQMALPSRGWEWWDLGAGLLGIAFVAVPAAWRARLPPPA